ncbi:CGNR zinc finger domain-containing protein [Actinomadura kijaniata]|uniref:Putative RNA-binding Zn ribbon-like protein n=1 Tax=Actinomadura namibiensis TaxID=182080 RepID=A0A7W3LLG6_ACTNM|nr:CGNR zinc finger domain-containing protein [Actinomadura namibiensis]MBA8950314.1 putative RNA-binding Zn ribbon-like protein [Actinomadura namibiensis]
MTRPLTGEPLALDLVNTVWIDQGRRFDLFDEPDGLPDWLAGHDLPAADGALDPLLRARDAVRAALTGDEEPLNAVLARGSRRPVLRDGEPAVETLVDDPAWLPAWTAAADLVRLYAQRPDRVRKCANPECVLWFHDVSKNGSRRWCSMEICGNRAKTARFQETHRRRR